MDENKSYLETLVILIYSKKKILIYLQLVEGRKQVGGKLEVKIRVRDPFKGKQVEETKEKWLVIDQFIRALGPKVSYNNFNLLFDENIK